MLIGAKMSMLTWLQWQEANNYWEDLWEKDIVPSHKLEDYKAMYQSQLNALRSESVKLCPKSVQYGSKII